MALVAVAIGLAASGCNLLPAPVVSGQVVSTSQKPLVGVVVAASDGETVTDQDGRWQILSRASKVSLSKPGFSAQTVSITAGRVILTSQAGNLRVNWDERWSNLPGDGLASWLAGQGLEVRALRQGLAPPADVTVMLSPAYFAQWALQDTLNAIKEGQTLILAGTWGGYAGIDLTSLNALANPAGITFGGSLVRERNQSTGAPLAIGFVDSFLAPAQGVEFLAPGTLGVQSPAHVFAQTSSNTYRVSSWAFGPQVVGAYGPLGKGKVIAIADATCWSDSPMGADGKPGWQVAGNAQLALNLIRF